MWAQPNDCRKTICIEGNNEKMDIDPWAEWMANIAHGKTTPTRAINNEQAEGTPPKTEPKTAFVEHGIGEAEPECDRSAFDHHLDEPVIKQVA